MKNVFDLSEREGEDRGVKLSSIFEWKIVDAIKKGVQVKVTRDDGVERVLVVNLQGDLCYLEGNNKKIFTDVKGWYLAEDIRKEIDGEVAENEGKEIGCGLRRNELGPTETLKAIIAVLEGKTASPKEQEFNLDFDDDPFDYELYQKELNRDFNQYPLGDLLRVGHMIGILRRNGVILQAIYKMDSGELIISTSFAEERMAQIFADLARKYRLNFQSVVVGRMVHIKFYDLTVQQVMNLGRSRNLQIKMDWGRGGNVTNYHGGAHTPSGHATANPGQGQAAGNNKWGTGSPSGRP